MKEKQSACEALRRDNTCLFGGMNVICTCPQTGSSYSVSNVIA